MSLNVKLVTKVLCAVAAVVGVAMLIPGIIALVYHEAIGAKVFLICGAGLALAGFLLFKLIPKTETSSLKTRDGFFVVAFAWLGMSALGALPFVLSGDIPNYASAFFETASGFSTTGASCLENVEGLTHGALFWRSFTHWLGGMGVLVMTVALLPKLGIGGQKIMRAETTGLTLDKSSFTFSKSAQNLYKLYILLTAIEFILLMIAGLTPFDSILHTFGTVGTGGFSTHNASVAAFGSIGVELIIALFMIICGINFSNIGLMAEGNFKKAFQDTELKVYFGIIAAATVMLTLILVFNSYSGFGKAVRDAFFQVASLITTTGYGTANFDKWPEACKPILFALMFIGGCEGSTGGGLKVIRIVLIVKMVMRSSVRKLHPNNIVPVRIGKNTISDDIVLDSCGFLGLYILAAFIGTFLLSFENVDMLTSFSSVISALSNIGPGFALVGPTMNYAFYSPAAKILLGILMIGGRLELYTLFVTIAKKR